MQKKKIIEFLGLLTISERLILATFEGSDWMPEAMDRVWNNRALENLVLHGLIQWTDRGYDLTEMAKPLAQYLHEQEPE